MRTVCKRVALIFAVACGAVLASEYTVALAQTGNRQTSPKTVVAQNVAITSVGYTDCRDKATRCDVTVKVHAGADGGACWVEFKGEVKLNKASGSKKIVWTLSGDTTDHGFAPANRGVLVLNESDSIFPQVEECAAGPDSCSTSPDRQRVVRTHRNQGGWRESTYVPIVMYTPSDGSSPVLCAAIDPKIVSEE